MMRSHYCGQLNESLDGQEVTLCGWVHRRRDHGGVIFLDVRDREGLAQVVFDPDRAETFAKADRVRSEFVVKITGRVRLRPEGARNPNMASGSIEVLGYELEVLNQAETPPFPLDEYSDVGEETRLRYRFIDLRRPEMAAKLKLRARITSSIRRYLDDNGFLDVETPILGRPTPEGARDYLVPSRTYPGHFFALPQSPQLFKQLLMVAGFDRYYQIAKCFRDEDLRADRQPEFTQIDIETSFLDESDIIAITEKMVRQLFKEVLGVEFDEFPHMPFEEAMRRYGSDKPDLRIPLELVDVADQLQEVEFKVFSGPANDPKGRVAALRVPGAASMPRSQIDDYTKFVGIYGAKGLAYIKVNERAKGVEGLQSPIVKFIPVQFFEIHRRNRDEIQQTRYCRCYCHCSELLDGQCVRCPAHQPGGQRHYAENRRSGFRHLDHQQGEVQPDRQQEREWRRYQGRNQQGCGFPVRQREERCRA